MLTFGVIRRVGWLLALASLLAASGCFGDTDEEWSAPPTAEVRGCRERIEGGGGGSFIPVQGRDTVAGPVTFLGAKATYRRTPPTSEPTRRGVPMKVPTIVRSGAPATLVVPRSERGWLHLAYVRPTDAVKLKPCPHPVTPRAQRRACHWSPYSACRSGLTSFAGGFFLDFRHAPMGGRCATLHVWVGESTDPITTRLFAGGGCPS
jgi:hypothetical protein